MHVAGVIPNSRGAGQPSTCTSITPACQDGIDNDGDGFTDFFADAGCFAASDPSERAPYQPCDDGLDNDSDGLIDFPSDPGCDFNWSRSEAPACNDGVDNDGDGPIDHPLDPGCASPADASESSSGGCGLGAELALVMPLLGLPASRRRRAAN